MTNASSPELMSALKKVYEAIRYSDPMSNEALASTEAQITVKFDELAEAANSGNANKVRDIADEIVILINDRNNKCRLLK